MLHNFDFGLATLFLIDGVIVIAVVCDPLDRLEKSMFWTYCQFQNSSRCANGAILDEVMQQTTVEAVVEETPVSSQVQVSA